MALEATETRHCSGCGQDKPLQQFQVTATNRDGTTWVRTRKWCLACCNKLAEKQKAARAKDARSREWIYEREEERRQALGPLPPWCDRHVMDYLVNGSSSALITRGNIGGWGQIPRKVRAKTMLSLWQEFQKHERATSEPLGGRGARFMKAMADLLQEPEAKFRQKLKRMSKHEEELLGIFETAPTARSGRGRSKLRPV